MVCFGKMGLEQNGKQQGKYENDMDNRPSYKYFIFSSSEQIEPLWKQEQHTEQVGENQHPIGEKI